MPLVAILVPRQEFDVDLDESGNLKVVWDKQYRPKSKKTKDITKSYFGHQIRRLVRLKTVDWNFEYDDKEDIGMTRWEWYSIWKYVDANIEAMTEALKTLEDKKVDTCSSETGDEGTCSAATTLGANSLYDMLEYEWDDLPYAQDTCNFDNWMKTYKRSYPVIESLETMYQSLQFKEHPGHDDTCMELDRIVQVRMRRCWTYFGYSF